MKIFLNLLLYFLPISLFAQDSTLVTTFAGRAKPVLPMVNPSINNCVAMETEIAAAYHFDFKHGHYVGTPDGEWLSARCPKGKVANGLRAAVVTSATFSTSYFKWNYYCCSLETSYPAA